MKFILGSIMKANQRIFSVQDMKAFFLMIFLLALLSFPHSVFASGCCSMELQVNMKTNGSLNVRQSKTLRVDPANPVPYMDYLCDELETKRFFSSTALKHRCIDQKPAKASSWTCNVNLDLRGGFIPACSPRGSSQTGSDPADIVDVPLGG